MKAVQVSGLSFMLHVSDNYDRKEVQEHLDLINLDMQRNVVSSGSIMGIDNLQDSDIEIIEELCEEEE